MRLLPLLLLPLLAGCDMARETYLDRRDDLMRQISGTWAVSSTYDAIYPDGRVVPQPAQSLTGTAEIGTSILCPGQTQINAVGENDRVAKFTGVLNRCYVVKTDHTHTRLIFVAEGTLSTDVPYTIDEASGAKQVWSAYTVAAGNAYTVRHRLTLTK